MSMAERSKAPKWALVLGTFAVLFGLATIVSGGRVVFGLGSARADAGAYVGFVVWFNFLAGFAYVAAGAGLLLWRGWSAPLAFVIAAATLLVAGAFALHVIGGGAYEMRTVAAMALRAGVWVAIAVLACRSLGCRLFHP